MKKTFKSAIAMLMVVAMLFVSAAAAGTTLSDFSDAPAEGNWMYNGLKIAVENGIMNGTDGKLNPTGSLTRAQMIAMVVRVLGASEMKADISSFIDVPANAWYADAISAGYAIGIVNGSGNKMNPDAPISRQETFTILYRAFMYKVGNHGVINSFADGGKVSAWAKDAAAALIDADVVNGANGNINPLANVTRAEFTTMLSRIVSVYINDASDIPAGGKIEGNVVINAPGITLDGVTINGNLYVADGVEGGKVNLNNVTISGEIVHRGGTIVKDGVDVTPSAPVVPDTPVVPDKPEDSGNSSADSSPNNGGMGGSSSSETKLQDGSYITYSVNGGSWKKLYADVDSDCVVFDFTAIDEDAEATEIVFDELYIKASKTLTCAHSGLGVSFKSNTAVDVVDILADISEKGFSIVSVAFEGEYPTLAELIDRMETAYLAYTDGGLAEIFESIDITFDGEGEAIFAGKIGTKDVDLHFVVPVIAE